MYSDELNHLISDATISGVTEERIIEILVNLLSMDQLECAHRNILAEWRDEGGDVTAHESTEYGDNEGISTYLVAGSRCIPITDLSDEALTTVAVGMVLANDVICADCDHLIDDCKCAWCYDCDRPTEYCHCKKVPAQSDNVRRYLDRIVYI